MQRTRRSGRLSRTAAILALIVLGLAAVLVAGSGPAYRSGLLALGEAFGVLRYGVLAAAGAGGLGLIILITTLWHRRPGPALTGGLVVAGSMVLVSIPVLHWQQAQKMPPIHDITTDTRDPPAFEALVAAREAAPNAVGYPGEGTARQQRLAYPDIGPLQLQAPLSRVLEAAEAEVLAFGWEVAAVTGDRIEATATTLWFGFRDDVVIRLREEDDGVRVDMRSASRVGRSDVGTNAARIRAYLDALERRVTQRD
jgi:uncharacterized protein (DUF1499 family)